MINSNQPKNFKPSRLILLLVALLFTLSIRQVVSVNTHVCEWTNDNNFCVESTDESFRAYGGCREGYKDSFTSVDQVPNCKKGTCVPNGQGGCLSDKYKIACIKDNSGRWYDQQLNQVADCQLGCCNVANSLCGIKEKKVCVQDTAKGNVNAYNSLITDQASCDNSCRTADKGCCKNGDSYKWATRDNCKTGEFFSETQCKNVQGYNAVSHKYSSCGDSTENDDKFDIYWYDSNNNREDIAQKCDYPYKICQDPDGKGGKEASCVSTSCVDDCPDCFPGQLRTGESVCLNALNTFYGDEKRSTGLNNYLLRCQWGNVEPDNTDNNREKKCIEQTGLDGRVNAKFIANTYNSCTNCGGPSGITDVAAYAPIIGPPIADLFGNVCSVSKCSEAGNCKYDRDFIWTPIGSCNAKYPPGRNDRCGECGKGGDSLTNLCTDTECNSLGDCQFKQQFTSESLIATGGLAIGTCASVLTLSQVLCAAPIWGQASCRPAWMAGAFNVCAHAGSNTLFWGLVGMFYGTSATIATADNYEPDNDVFIANQLSTGRKIKLGPAIGFTHGALSNVSLENAVNVEDNKYNVPYGRLTTSTLPVLVPQVANYLTIKALPYYIIQILSAGTVPISWGAGLFISPVTVLQIANFLNMVVLPLSFVSTATGFQTGKCIPEQPYNTNEYCETCGAGEAQWYCTEQRCNILGGTNGRCRFFPTNSTAYGKCLAVPKDDFTKPVVTKIDIKFLDNTKNLIKEYSSSSKSLEIAQKINWNTAAFNLNINTDEKAKCTFSGNKGSSYESGFGFDEDSFQSNHEIELNISEADKIDGINLYFKCEDLSGNKIDKTDDTSFVSFKFEKRPDTLPPAIQKIDPKSSILLPASIKNLTLSLIVYDGVDTDAAECKYTKSNSTNYGEYENMFTKGEKIGCQSTTNNDCRQFTANIDLTQDWSKNFTINNRTIYSYSLNINCKDDSGNIGYEPQQWTMLATEMFNLMINNPGENEQLYNRKPFINITTSEVTACNYTISGKEFVLDKQFDYEHSIYHSELLDQGNYNIKVKCNDLAGNELVGERNFQILVDSNSPKIIRLYKTQGKLCLQLDGQAECRYDFKQIAENGYENAAGMVDGNLENSHCTALNEGRVYYFKCRDTWNNEMSAVVYP